MSSYVCRFLTSSPDRTRQLGRIMASRLNPNDVLALYGDLAGGKTTFAAGMTDFFHSEQPATSPTFTLINEYSGDLDIFHLDCYRLKHPDEIVLMGFEDYLTRGGIVLIEWPDKIEPHLPHALIRI